MTAITPSTVFRDYATDGVSASGANRPSKSEIRKLLGSGLVRTPQWYGAVGDGSTDDAVALQAWLDATPNNGSAFLPEASGGYYKCGTALTHSGRITITGCGIGSRIHYTGSGVALTLSLARFCRMENWYLTGTSSAAGGCYVKSSQQGFSAAAWFVEGFTGAGAYGTRFSSCWTLNWVGGRSNGAVGIWFDTTNDTVAGLNNSINLFQVDLSNCATYGIDAQKGYVFNIIGCDFSTTGTGIELGRGITGTDTIRNVNVIGCYFESTNCIYVGRGATTSVAPSYIRIEGNYLTGGTNCIHLYVADSVSIGPQTMAGTNTIDSGVTGTQWSTENAVTDNSAAGNTTYIRGNTGLIQASSITATTTFKLPIYTVSTLPAQGAGKMIYVSNESGGAVPAFSDGTNWRRMTDRNTVS